MPRKVQLISALFEETLNEITKSSKNWINFLNSATWNFGYGFADKVCIYAQRPDALACATMEEWNKKARRWILPDSKAIALLKTVNGISSINYVFDITDTHQYNNKNYNLWQVDRSYDNELINSLKQKYQLKENCDDLISTIYAVSCTVVNDRIGKCIEKIKQYKEGSNLENLDDIDLKLRAILNNSVAYMALNRCNIDPMKYFVIQDFKDIDDFNTYNTAITLGVQMSEIARDIIYEIKNTARGIEKNHTIESNSKIEYNLDEGSEDYGNRLSETRRIQDTKLNSNGTKANNEYGEIRNSEGKVSNVGETRAIRNIENERPVGTTFDRNTKSSRTTNKANDGSNDDRREYNRRNEEKRSNEMDRSDEQSEKLSRRNSDGRTNIQLDLNSIALPSVSQQINDIEENKINKEKQQIILKEENIQKDKQEKINYHINNNSLGGGTPKEKAKKNIEAIKVLKKLEDENRLANSEEQKQLAEYVGWGGLQEVFDETKSNWDKEYQELKEILTDEEYSSARVSTLTAFYTSPIIIENMYKVIQKMELNSANILEPSCGTGKFIGMVPNELNAQMYGVELDSISGRISKQLYQKSNIVINGFENVNLPDNFFDIAIGNIPFR